MRFPVSLYGTLVSEATARIGSAVFLLVVGVQLVGCGDDDSTPVTCNVGCEAGVGGTALTGSGGSDAGREAGTGGGGLGGAAGVDASLPEAAAGADGGSEASLDADASAEADASVDAEVGQSPDTGSETGPVTDSSQSDTLDEPAVDAGPDGDGALPLCDLDAGNDGDCTLNLIASSLGATKGPLCVAEIKENCLNNTSTGTGDVSASNVRTCSILGGYMGGASREQLCLDVVACMFSHVSCLNNPLPTGCYCGSASGATCFTPGAANGPCKAQEEAALGSTSPSTISNLWMPLLPDLRPGQVANAIAQCIFDQNLPDCQ